MSASESTAALHVLSPGGACYQDLGRIGWERSGLSVNGAMDAFSAQTANILVGNRRTDPFIEVMFTGCEFSVIRTTLVAAVAPGRTLRIDGVLQQGHEPVIVWPGQHLSVSPPADGARTAFAVRGLLAPDLLGSVSPDPLVGFTNFLVAGTDIPAHEVAHTQGCFPAPVWSFRPTIADTSSTTIPVVAGPDAEELEGGIASLHGREFTVGSASNSIGIRLHGPAPKRLASSEHVSRGVPVGAVEYTPSGELIILHRSRYVTAGYPVVAVATGAGLDALGQVVPGAQVRLAVCDLAQALADHRRRTAVLDRLEDRVTRAFAETCLATA